jgi:hypothetical protein
MSNSADEDMPEIYTGNGKDRDLAATTNDRLKRTVLQLKRTVEELQVLNVTIGQSYEEQLKMVEAEHKTRESLHTLTTTIKSLDAKNGNLQDKLYWLTWATVVLAIVQTVFGGFQIWLYFHPIHP